MGYLKRLNWGGFLFVIFFTGIGSMTRKQDPDIYTSLMVWVTLGIPIGLIFLFTGIKPKE